MLPSDPTLTHPPLPPSFLPSLRPSFSPSLPPILRFESYTGSVHEVSSLAAHDVAVKSGALAQILIWTSIAEAISVIAISQMLEGSGRQVPYLFYLFFFSLSFCRRHSCFCLCLPLPFLYSLKSPQRPQPLTLPSLPERHSPVTSSSTPSTSPRTSRA